MDPYGLHPPAVADQLRRRDEKIDALADFLDQRGRPSWIRVKRLFRRQPANA